MNKIMLFIITSFFSADAQVSIDAIVFKVEYHYKQAKLASSAYVLLPTSGLEENQLEYDSSQSAPRLIYNITLSGGQYIAESFTDLYALGCCEFNNIEMAVLQNIDNNLTKEKINKYSNVNKLSVSLFDKIKGSKIIAEDAEGKYKITMWMSKMTFCTCKIFMETPGARILGDQGAYVININSIERPKGKIRKQARAFVKLLMRLDIRSAK